VSRRRPPSSFNVIARPSDLTRGKAIKPRGRGLSLLIFHEAGPSLRARAGKDRRPVLGHGQANVQCEPGHLFRRRMASAGEAGLDLFCELQELACSRSLERAVFVADTCCEGRKEAAAGAGTSRAGAGNHSLVFMGWCRGYPRGGRAGNRPHAGRPLVPGRVG
jgi:hypothetical protein